MAIFVYQHVLFDNYDAARGLQPGMAVALSADTNGRAQCVAAYRAASHNFLGLAGDSSATSSVTMAVIDPVSPGNYSTDSGAGTDPFAYSGPAPVARPARKLADYMDEGISNITNWTDVDSNGRSTPKRGMTVYRHGGRFSTDQYISTSSGGSDATDVGAAPTFSVDQALTIGGTLANAGKLIVYGSHGTVVARIKNPSVTSGLLEIILV